MQTLPGQLVQMSLQIQIQCVVEKTQTLEPEPTGDNPGSSTDKLYNFRQRPQLQFQFCVQDSRFCQPDSL